MQRKPPSHPSHRYLSLGLLTTAAFALASLAGCGHADAQPTVDPPDRSVAIVDRVIDGDTVDLRIGQQIERVRLIGIDTPESVAPSVPEQCFGAEASAALRELLPVGSEVTISRDVEARDRYDRLLLYLHRRDDGLFVNRWLIEAGMADAVSYEPNTSHQHDFEIARNEAKAGAQGLWANCDGPDQPLQ